MNLFKLQNILDILLASILRVKGCTRFDGDTYYSMFEKLPTREIFVHTYHGSPITGRKMIVIGPGSNPELLSKLISRVK